MVLKCEKYTSDGTELYIARISEGHCSCWSETNEVEQKEGTHRRYKAAL
jgi:hypothetical protein